MIYPSGEEVRIGDHVKLWHDCFGEVVAAIDRDEFSSKYPKQEWDYLRSGVLIESDKAGLIHYLQPEKTFELIRRASLAKQ